MSEAALKALDEISEALDDANGHPDLGFVWDCIRTASASLATLRAALAPAPVGDGDVSYKPKFPPVIRAFCTPKGEWQFDTVCGTLFPVGKEHQYVDADCTRQAALLFRNPDNFCALLDAFMGSQETEVSDKLDDALRAIARAGRNGEGK